MDQKSQLRYCVADPLKVLVVADAAAMSMKTASLSMMSVCKNVSREYVSNGVVLG